MPKKIKRTTEKSVRPGKGIIAGELEKLIPRLHKAIEQNSGNLTIDCSRVTRIDPPGLAVVVGASNSCLGLGGKVVLNNVDGKIADLFQLLGLGQQIEIHPKNPPKSKGATS